MNSRAHFRGPRMDRRNSLRQLGIPRLKTSLVPRTLFFRACLAFGLVGALWVTTSLVPLQEVVVKAAPCTTMINGDISAADPTMTPRVLRNDPPNVCGDPPTYPGDSGLGGSFHYDAYTIFNRAASCVTVTLDPLTCNTAGPPSLFLHSVAYLGSFDPANISANYLADIGNSPSTAKSYSFNVPANTNFVVIVNETVANAGCPGYTLTITNYDCINPPTAGDSTISGRVNTSAGTAVAGATVRLSGLQSGRTITNGNGEYRFENLESGGFYTVTPSRANFSFAPASQSFSLVGNKTDATFNAEATAQTANPVDTAEFFVRQNYLDFLNREPDSGGFEYWVSRFDGCAGDGTCLHRTRLDVSAAFVIEQEFQQTGSFIYRMYKSSYGRRPSYAQFVPDRSEMIGGASAENSKQAFAARWVQRPEFRLKYPEGSSGPEFVDALLRTVKESAGVDLSAQRNALISDYATHGSRARVVQMVADDPSFTQAEYNQAFVLSDYFGYLRRDPDEGGYRFWLDVLNNREPGNYAGIVCAFVTSAEYQQRFGSLVTRNNSQCGR